MNIKANANYRYNKWWDCVCKESAAVPMAAAQSSPYPVLEQKVKPHAHHLHESNLKSRPGTLAQVL